MSDEMLVVDEEATRERVSRHMEELFAMIMRMPPDDQVRATRTLAAVVVVITVRLSGSITSEQQVAADRALALLNDVCDAIKVRFPGN